MSIARSFRTLAFYDLLTNLVPGAAYISAITVLLAPLSSLQTIPSGVVVGGFLILSYTAGHLIQAVGSWAENPTTFGGTIQALQYGEHSTSPITITYIEREFWRVCIRNFNIRDPENFSDYGKLLKLLLSHLETTPHTRALRFQTLHSFHRSMWAASLLLLGTIALFTAAAAVGYLSINSYLVAGLLAGVSVIGWGVFRSRKEKFNKTFVQYVILDIYDSFRTGQSSLQYGG